jgi:hypothetical protein
MKDDLIMIYHDIRSSSFNEPLVVDVESSFNEPLVFDAESSFNEPLVFDCFFFVVMHLPFLYCGEYHHP